LTSSWVDCWGDGTYGQLGDGQYYTTSPWGSAIPVQVEGTNGTGVLSGVAQMASSASGGSNNVCALLTSGRVDCWGFGGNGDLGNDQYYTTYPYGSAVPVQVQ
jgi:alpha-tubulin suppressor-like RCC1 family protein